MEIVKVGVAAVDSLPMGSLMLLDNPSTSRIEMMSTVVCHFGLSTVVLVLIIALLLLCLRSVVG